MRLYPVRRSETLLCLGKRSVRLFPGMAIVGVRLPSGRGCKPNRRRRAFGYVVIKLRKRSLVQRHGSFDTDSYPDTNPNTDRNANEHTDRDVNPDAHTNRNSY